MTSSLPRAAASLLSRPFIVLLAATALLAACHKQVSDPNDPKFIVAEGAGLAITRGDLNHELGIFLQTQGKQLSDVDPARMPMLESVVLKNLVVKKLILQHAATLNLQDVDKEDAAMLAKLKGQFPTEADFQAKLQTTGMTEDQLKEQIHEGTLLHKTLDAEAFKGIEPSDQEINTFYVQNKDRLPHLPEKVRASRVLVVLNDKATPAQKAAAKKKIQLARARVAKGEAFSKVAQEMSDDRYSAPKGGDVGYFAKGENEPEFDTVAFNTKPGVLSPVFETPMGYQFLEVTDVHPGGVASVAEERDDISKYLMRDKQRDALETYAQKLLADNQVKFHLVGLSPDQLPGAPTPAQKAAADAAAQAETTSAATNGAPAPSTGP